ncbi:hypothetical protein SAMN05428961_11014 [Paenibacillus sp. OK060]|nr:hypothetical protein SAMN05428961_11014 [Paenibacillus sp. OK060]
MNIDPVGGSYGVLVEHYSSTIKQVWIVIIVWLFDYNNNKSKVRTYRVPHKKQQKNTKGTSIENSRSAKPLVLPEPCIQLTIVYLNRTRMNRVIFSTNG